MIIKELTVENFRVFKGLHNIQLEPHQAFDRPVILFGGLNGAGKTSILTAVRLALYGKLAFAGVSSSQEYIDKLDALIHNGSDSENSASVALVFTYNKEGQQSEFRVKRSWHKGRKDTLVLWQDDEKLRELDYDQCQGFLNELIPSGIADLFFFDGEKISELAEDKTGQTLQVAVRRLLGLDLIEKLKNDLVIFLKRQAARKTEENYRAELELLEADSVRLGQSAENFRYAADLVKISLGLVDADIRKQESILAAQGGAFAASKANEQAKVDGLIKERSQLERALKAELEGLMPLSLAPSSINALIAELNEESSVKQSLIFRRQLSEFLSHMTTDGKFPSEVVRDQTVKVIEEGIRTFVQHPTTTEIHFDISDRELGAVTQVAITGAKNSKTRFEKVKGELAATDRALEEASSNIGRAPDDEQLQELVGLIRELDRKRQQKLDEYHSLLEKARQALMEQLECNRKLQKMHDNRRLNFDANSAVTNAQDTLNIIEEYSEALTKARVSKLEENFALAYTRLARKKGLKLLGKINPLTFDVELHDLHGAVIDRETLSAGEKQIYALAILDALAKTSGRQLPVIIDTPLGRLDSQHRDTLIENYFPNASHQVIILSTDTEINQSYYFSELRRSVSHSYKIDYNEKTRSSSLNVGYFWPNGEERDNDVA